jgi:hypothetical protein
MSERESSGIMARAGSRSARSAALRWSFALVTLAALVCALSGSSRAQSQSTASKAAPASATTPAKIAVADTVAVTQAATPKPAAAPAASAGRSAPKGEQEGIKVHGHWIVEVRNPDGKVASHTEFENSYLIGDEGLPVFLSRTRTLGEWGIVLGNSSPSLSPCTAALATPFTGTTNSVINAPLCVISESGPAIEGENLNGLALCTPANGSCSQNLTVGLNTTGALPAVGLSGSLLATNPGTINQVETIVSACGTALSSTACATETAQDSPNDVVFVFTTATLPAQGSGTCGGATQPSCAVNVSTAGQTIAVTVTISFQ